MWNDLSTPWWRKFLHRMSYGFVEMLKHRSEQKPKMGLGFHSFMMMASWATVYFFIGLIFFVFISYVFSEEKNWLNQKNWYSWMINWPSQFRSLDYFWGKPSAPVNPAFTMHTTRDFFMRTFVFNMAVFGIVYFGLIFLFRRRLIGIYQPCPYQDCNKSINVFVDWQCDHCNNYQGKKRFIHKACRHCGRHLFTAYCEHCHQEFRV